MTREPKYYRARIDALRVFGYDKDTQTQKWLQNGFIPDKLKDQFEAVVEEKMNLLRDRNKPLSFLELTTLSTWFDMHPEKVAGTIQGGTSLYFPVIVKGTKADVEKMFANTLAATPAPQQPTAAAADYYKPTKYLPSDYVIYQNLVWCVNSVNRDGKLTIGRRYSPDSDKYIYEDVDANQLEPAYKGIPKFQVDDKVKLPDGRIVHIENIFIRKDRFVYGIWVQNGWQTDHYSDLEENQLTLVERPQPKNEEDDELEMLELEAEALKLKLKLLK